jgi:CubicO group peptidase (beta-lactamase class C family)
VILLVIVAAAIAGYLARRSLLSSEQADFYRTAIPVGTGFTAKVLCSAVFIAGRDPAEVLATDLDIMDFSVVEAEVDRDKRTATARGIGLLARAIDPFPHTAVYREGLGCTLAIGVTPDELRRQVEGLDLQPSPPPPADLPWPEGERVDPPTDVDTAALEAALDDAFAEPDPEQPRYTRAVVVVHRGRIIAERYAPGFTRDTELVGWSMTKSVTNALVGILAGRGALDIHAPAAVPEWSSPDDPRHAITLDQLMRMSSGLEFVEIYDSKPDSDDALMLYTMADSAAFAASKSLEAPPDTRWHYSSGTTNIISRIVRDAVDPADYWSLPRRVLFDRIGMTSAVLEPDASGTFVGSSYMYATARDWARFGLLYLRDGVWNGARILPEGWVEYSTSPTPTGTPGVSYGAQIWLNLPSPPDSDQRWLPFLPEDAYVFRGYARQYVIVIPSREIVVVRLGHTRHGDLASPVEFVGRILEALD